VTGSSMGCPAGATLRLPLAGVVKEYAGEKARPSQPSSGKSSPSAEMARSVFRVGNDLDAAKECAQGRIELVDDEGSFDPYLNSAAAVLEHRELKRAVTVRTQAHAIEPFEIVGVRSKSGWLAR
jgi:hypothetical protein